MLKLRAFNTLTKRWRWVNDIFSNGGTIKEPIIIETNESEQVPFTVRGTSGLDSFQVRPDGHVSLAEGWIQVTREDSSMQIYIGSGEDLIYIQNALGQSVFYLKDDGTIRMPKLPIVDPEVVGWLWNDSGTVKVSAG